MSFGGVAVTVLVLIGGLTAVPAAASAQVGTAGGSPPASAVSPAETALGPAEDAAAREDEDGATQKGEDATVPRCPPADDQVDESLRDLSDAVPDPQTRIARADDSEPPIAHCSQNAGDEQYKDPFANSGPPKADGKDGPSDQNSKSSGGDGVASSSPASVFAQQSASPTDDPAVGGEGSGSGLPNTGLDAGPPGLAGLALLLCGVALRRRIV